MTCENDSTLWKAIDWKGQFNPVPPNDENRPSETEFQEHLEKLLKDVENYAADDSKTIVYVNLTSLLFSFSVAKISRNVFISPRIPIMFVK